MFYHIFCEKRPEPNLIFIIQNNSFRALINSRQNAKHTIFIRLTNIRYAGKYYTCNIMLKKSRSRCLVTGYWYRNYCVVGTKTIIISCFMV